MQQNLDFLFSQNTLTGETMPAVRPNFGVLVFGDFTATQKVSVAKSLGCKYVRSSIVMQTWGSSNGTYNSYVMAGLKVVLNINWGQPSGGIPVPYPTNMTTYKSILTDILTNLPVKPDYVAIENEELNLNYHSGPLTDYVEELRNASLVCKPLGVKIMNGGIGERLNTPCFRWVKANIGQTEADAFGNITMGTAEHNGANNPGSQPTLEASVADVETMLTAVANYADLFNIHYYEVYNPNIIDIAGQVAANALALHYIKMFVEARTGKPCVTNETGVRTNTQPDLVYDIMQKYYDENFSLAVYFSGDDSDADAKGLQNADTTLRPTGVYFRNFIDSNF